MPTYFFPLTILAQKFEDEKFLAEAINFHEISRFHTAEDTAVYNIRLNAEQILKDAAAAALHTRLASPDVEVKEILIEVEPPKKSAAWRESLNLKFHVLQMERADGFCQAYVPALGIAVLSKKSNDFETNIRREILSALKRDGWTKSLKFLRQLERIEEIRLHREEIAVQLPTAKQRAVAEEAGESDEKSVLAETGADLTKIKLATAYETEKQVAALAEIFRAKQKTSVLLVGAPGVGKTAIFHELVRNRENLELSEYEFWATTGSRLIAGQSGFGMWQERSAQLISEARKRRAILHLGNLFELAEVGKSESSAQGIASFLRPKIARGELLVVCESTPEQLTVLERRDPQLLSAFQQIRIEEPDRQTNLKILESIAKEFAAEAKSEAAREAEAIKIVDAVHRRFSTYSAFPGRPARFLRNLFYELGSQETLAPQDVYRAFSNETGLPEMLLNDAVRLELTKTEKFFAERVIGQPEAVKLVTKLIATVKAKLTRPRRPVASLLFIGPTGVGKTELTKALAEFFFSDASRMIRFDMSEFSSSLAVQRLIGSTGEEEGLLTAKVREQPFSVVLLDEFEKAHHSFFDLLLQILGEGRLTDQSGRLADFTNAVIVMTSNLGASEFQRGKSGFTQNTRERRRQQQQREAFRHFDSAVKNFLRPEIYNRLDRIVPFAPLNEKSILKIAELEIEKLKRRDGLRFRPVRLEIGTKVLNHLAAAGYDVRYGARPLKRAIERELLAPLSAELNLRPPAEKLIVDSAVREGKITLAFTGDEQKKAAAKVNLVLAAQAERIAGLRRRVQTFSASYRLTEISDELYQIARLKALELRRKWLSDEDKERIKRQPKLENFLKNARDFSDEINLFEDETLLEIYGKPAAGENQNRPAQIEMREKAFQNYLFELLSLQYQKPDEIKLTLFGENAAALFRLARLYLAIVKKIKGEITKMLVFTTQKQGEQETERKSLFDRTVFRREIPTAEDFLHGGAAAEIVGMLLNIRGELALPLFGSERGVHRFVAAGGKSNLVMAGSTDVAEFEKFEIDDNLAKRDSLKSQIERRIYDPAQNQIRDLALHKTFSLENTELAEVFTRAVEENLQRAAESLIE